MYHQPLLFKTAFCSLTMHVVRSIWMVPATQDTCCWRTPTGRDNATVAHHAIRRRLMTLRQMVTVVSRPPCLPVDASAKKRCPNTELILEQARTVTAGWACNVCR